MKKVVSLAVLFAASMLVSCSGNKKADNNTVVDSVATEVKQEVEAAVDSAAMVVEEMKETATEAVEEVK